MASSKMCPKCSSLVTLKKDEAGRRSGSCGECGHKMEADAPEWADPGALSGRATTGGLPPKKPKSSRRPSPNPRPESLVPAEDEDAPRYKLGELVAGRFIIVKELGSGSFGTVYHAMEQGKHRDVALKLPDPGVLADRSFLNRFRAEADILRRLDHPNIVHFYEAQVDRSPRFLSLEFVDGHDLESELVTGRKTREWIIPKRAVQIVIDLANALHHAHLENVIHRDVKPANILIQKRGDIVKLADFGLGRHGDPKQTAVGTKVGTPFYMSPEQVDGVPDRVGPKSDQYSLAVVLYELLCRRVPFEGNTREAVYEKIRKDRVPNPTEIDASIPAGLAAVCAKALSRDPAARWDDCGAFARVLQPWSYDPSASTIKKAPPAPDIGARPTPVEAPDRKTSRSEKLEEMAKRVKTGYEEGKEQVRQKVEQSMERLEPALKPMKPIFEASREAYEAGRTTIHSRWPDAVKWFVDTLMLGLNHLTAWIRSIEHAKPASDPDPDPMPEDESAEDEEDRTESAASKGAVLPRPGSGAGTDAKYRASSSSTRSTTVATSEASASRVGRVSEERAYFAKLEQANEALSGHRRAEAREILERCPVGRRGWEWGYLAALCRSRVINLAGHQGEAMSLAFSPDGGTIAVGEEEGVRVWESPTGRLIRRFAGQFKRGDSVAFSPDGRWLAAAGGKTIRAWDLRDPGRDDPSHSWVAHEGPISCLTFATDGVHLFSAGHDQVVRVWDFQADRELPTLIGPQARALTLAIHPTDPAVLFAGYHDGSVVAWDWNSGRERARKVVRNGTSVVALAVHPGGKLVVAGEHGGDLSFWGTTDLDMRGVVRAHLGEVSSLAFHPDGRWLASTGTGGPRSIRIGLGVPDSPEVGRELASIPFASAALAGLAFDPSAPGRLALIGSDRTVKLWDARALWDALARDAPIGLAQAVALDPTGRTRAVVRLDGSVEVVAAGTGPTVWPTVRAVALAFRPGVSKPTLAVAEESGVVTIRDATSGLETATIDAGPGPAAGLAFDADGHHFAVASPDGSVRVFDARTMTPVATIPAHDAKGATAVVFSATPDGLRLFSGGGDHQIHAWDPTTGDWKATLEGHKRRITALAASADGRRLVSVAEDRTLRIWDVAKAASILALREVDVLASVAWHPAVGALAVVGEDRSLITEVIRLIGPTDSV